MHRRHQAQGFSLVELLVVLAILAMAIALVPPMVSGVVDSSQIKNATRSLAAGLRYARGEAVISQRETTLTIDVENRRFSVAGREKLLELPAETRIKLTTAESERLSEHKGAVRFFPDGSSTGGQITLAGASKEYIIDINWLTGGVAILP